MLRIGSVAFWYGVWFLMRIRIRNTGFSLPYYSFVLRAVLLYTELSGSVGSTSILDLILSENILGQLGTPTCLPLSADCIVEFVRDKLHIRFRLIRMRTMVERSKSANCILT